MEDENDFLQDMETDTYVSQIKEKENIELNKKEQIQREKDDARATRNLLAKEKRAKVLDKIDKNKSEELEESSEILGKEKRLLLSKIQSYKQLFPEELKKFKTKKNCTIEELQAYIEEIQVIIEIDGTEMFVLDSIFQSLKMIEGYSAKTKYNISGLSDLLRMNKQFNSLCKQLMLKYGTFMNTPIEIQTGIIVVTSAYIMVQKNNKKNELNNYFNEEIKI